MPQQSEGFRQIEAYYEAFCKGIERCRNATTFDPADLQDAYNRLNRLLGRYEQEKHYIAESQRNHLRKVFEDDAYIEGLGKIRTISEHVTRRSRDTLMIAATDRNLIEVDPEVSAMAIFTGPVASVPDIHGTQWSLDHLSILEEAERRIGAAISKARG